MLPQAHGDGHTRLSGKPRAKGCSVGPRAGRQPLRQLRGLGLVSVRVEQEGGAAASTAVVTLLWVPPTQSSASCFCEPKWPSPHFDGFRHVPLSPRQLVTSAGPPQCSLGPQGTQMDLPIG